MLLYFLHTVGYRSKVWQRAWVWFSYPPYAATGYYWNSISGCAITKPPSNELSVGRMPQSLLLRLC
ncbi:hypothetical protein F2P79_001079 [Pimephales promelas]|nr:hypothetical protein F2P79_001079 [Pimephales promelas]